MSRAVLAAAALALLGAPVVTLAQSQERRAGIGSFEFQGGRYLPMIDSEFTPPGAAAPWEASFGTTRRWLFKARGGKAIISGYGTLELGAGAGYFSATGSGRFEDGSVSAEETRFKLVPLSLDLTYRLDPVFERLGIPLVPFGRIALHRDHWWVTGAGGSASKSGVTSGWGWGGGLGLVLDFIDPTLAREIDRDSGIKHTMVVVEVEKTNVNDFGSKTSWDLSNDGLLLTFGLMFAF